MEELKHHSHEHKLILNAAEPILYKKAVCVVCAQPVHEMLDMLYRCATTPTTSGSSCADFFLHKTCAELPSTFTHPAKPQLLLTLSELQFPAYKFFVCHVCQGFSMGGSVYVCQGGRGFKVCVKCVISALKSLEERSRCHPSHSHHPLTLIQSPSFFMCHACNTAATDLSYVCTKCWFCIHQSCANAPTIYQCRFHKEHSLVLEYSLPQNYRKFLHFCDVCEEYINPIHWVYYCANCRFFAHVNCASSVETSSGNEINPADPEESYLMHFPAPDEESLNKMMQQCVTTMATSGALQHNNAIVEEPSPYINHWAHNHRLVLRSRNTNTFNNAIMEKPSPYINHWAHEHQLVLRSRNTNTSSHDLNQELAHNELLICDGCTKPICLIDDFIYECNSCNYVLHRSCAQFPRKIQHHLAGNLDGLRFYNQRFRCRGCAIYSNGMCMSNGTVGLDIGCASLPRIIKHEAHRHHLVQLKYRNHFVCKACWRKERDKGKRDVIMFGCENCEFYMHIKCMFKPHKMKHRWDPHPLYLILFPKDVADHPHEYECEFCSEEINPNKWFYHCSVCDLSFHIYCIDPYRLYSNIKFGATNIYSKSHPCSHGLTYVQDKKKRRCKICNLETWSKPVLECSPCKFVAHAWCAGY